MIHKFTVTKDILKESSNCGWYDENTKENNAIARAIHIIFPGVVVNSDHIREKRNSKSVCDGWRVELPEAVKNFIEEFVEGTPYMRADMNEFEFELDIPKAS